MESHLTLQVTQENPSFIGYKRKQQCQRRFIFPAQITLDLDLSAWWLTAYTNLLEMGFKELS